MRKALIVLSEPDIARLVAEHLANQGFQSKVLTEGRPVFSHAREGQPDLIILNYNSLPDVFGADVCRALKADPSTRHIPLSKFAFILGPVLMPVTIQPETIESTVRQEDPRCPPT